MMNKIALRRGTEQFPRTVRSVNELPGLVRDQLLALRPALDLNDVVMIPPQSSPVMQSSWRRILPFTWEWTPYRTVVFGRDELLIIEGIQAGSLRTITIPVRHVIALRQDVVLLNSFFEINWVETDRVGSIRVPFNSVGERLFAPGLRQIRQTVAAANTYRHPAPPAASTHHLLLKFRNYAQISLLENETIRCAIDQPAIKAPGLRRWTRATPNRAIILTNYHLLVLEDGASGSSESPATRYRINRHFYPRAALRGIRPSALDGLDGVTMTVGSASTQQEFWLPLGESQRTTLTDALHNWFLS